MPKLTGDLPFLKNSRLRLSVDNLFDAQRKVTDASGIVPLSYQPGYTDSLGRSEEHTSELQSLMRISYAVFCLKKKTQPKSHNNHTTPHTYTQQNKIDLERTTQP